ncbi:MAG TPA: RsfS/YbeB/iojap family protein, partial [Acidisarcina sp.]
RLGEWVLLDYFDFVVHIFQTDKRAFYDIERLRKSARSVDLAELKIALVEKVKTVRSKGPNAADSGTAMAAKKVASKKTAAAKKGALKQTSSTKAGSTRVTAKKAPAGKLS